MAGGLPSVFLQKLFDSLGHRTRPNVMAKTSRAVQVNVNSRESVMPVKYRPFSIRHPIYSEP